MWFTHLQIGTYDIKDNLFKTLATYIQAISLYTSASEGIPFILGIPPNAAIL